MWRGTEFDEGLRMRAVAAWIVLQLLQERPDESLRARVQDAVRSCPKQALSLEED